MVNVAGSIPRRPELVRDDQTEAPGQVIEPLLTAKDVARILAVRQKRVYELGIPSVKISVRGYRWRPSDIATWIEGQRKA